MSLGDINVDEIMPCEKCNGLIAIGKGHISRIDKVGPNMSGVWYKHIDEGDCVTQRTEGLTVPDAMSFMPEIAKPAGQLVLQPEPFKTTFPVSVYPNWWRRFWYWNLLGWRFEKNE
jgi:hypothetical protein